MRFRTLLIALATTLPGLAVAGEPAEIPPGIYAMFEGSDPAAPTVAPNLTPSCQSRPTVVYGDGLLVGRKVAALDEIKAGAPYFSYLGSMRCTRKEGDTAACRLENGAPGSGQGVQMRDNVIRTVGGAVTLCQPDGNDCRLLVPCPAGMFLMKGPDGRDVFDELTRRDDGGVPLPRP